MRLAHHKFMKKSELRKLINEIVQRKLSESTSEIANSVNKLLQQGELKDVKILSQNSSQNLEIIEVWEDNGVLYFNVNTNTVEQNETIQEIGDIDTSAGETGLSDADRKELANLKGQSDKLTSNIKKIEGDTAKLQTAIQPKMQRWERQKAKLQKQQADVIRKQQSIQDKG